MAVWLVRGGALVAGVALALSGRPILGVAVTLLAFGYWIVDRVANRIVSRPDVTPSGAALALHRRAEVADLHADVCLWSRDLTRRHKRRGHVDLPRLREGGVSLQFVTVPTKLVLTKRAPRLFLSDLFFWGSLLSLERPDRWFSTAARARLQRSRISEWISASAGELVPIADRRSLAELRRRRADGEGVIGLMLGMEGAHALRDGIDIGWLSERGFRVLGLTHFNDTRFAGSAHGWRKRGLSDAGRELVRELERHHITIDLAHASERAIDDVLEMLEGGELRRPPIVSHTGLRGVHDHRRNIADRQAVEIAGRGGLIGISFFEPALARADIGALVESVRYTVDLLDAAGLEGARHVALGSDFDGAVKTVIDAAGWPSVTQKLVDAGVRGGADPRHPRRQRLALL